MATKISWLCGDGKRFPTLDKAKDHANRVFQQRGIIISVEKQISCKLS